MSYIASTEEAFAYHKATGCPVLRAKEVLEGMEPLLRERVLQAVSQKMRSRVLRDPIEEDPKASSIIAQAREEAEVIVKQRGLSGKGVCHSIWFEQARILQDKFQIKWFSPKEMNPGVFFD
ncbi:hypothetical protein V8J88_21310 [Massilia sp. W12]|uniref:hypothetical protein n=1 Tax=Massilia sp. W12 TaxID=3126507 RepID=UPI0030D5687C